jgi:inorganic pyrophosphatase
VLHLALLPLVTTAVLAAQQAAPVELPPMATTKFAESLEASKAHAASVWRDTPPVNADGTVNGYIEISRGDRRKFEFNMKANDRIIDRMIPPQIGGYPVNYGIVPQPVSYDGDPYDILVLGPPLAGGSLVRGIIVGLMHMEDEKGWDSKVVVSERGADGKPRYRLTASDQRRIGDYFNRYKRDQPGLFSRVPGWGSAAEGLSYVETTHAFFMECRERAGVVCRVGPSRLKPASTSD